MKKMPMKILMVALIGIMAITITGCRQFLYQGEVEADTGENPDIETDGTDNSGGTEDINKSLSLDGSGWVDIEFATTGFTSEPDGLYGDYAKVVLTVRAVDNATVKGATVDLTGAQWSSENSEVAKVVSSDKGIATIEGLKPGATVITVVTADGKMATHEIFVTASAFITFDLTGVSPESSGEHAGKYRLELPLAHDPTKQDPRYTDWTYVVGWGDGSEPEILQAEDYNRDQNLYPQHYYDEAKEYTLRIQSLNASVGLQGWSFAEAAINRASGSSFVGGRITHSGRLLHDVKRFGSESIGAGAFAFSAIDTLSATDKPSFATHTNYLFYGARNFNQDIKDWDVAGVTDMSYMFTNARSFNQDISNWNISGVTNMQAMFAYALQFNNGGQPLTWANKTSQVKDMSHMFAFTENFDQDISNWNVQNVRTMQTMFDSATGFTNGGQPLAWGEKTAKVQSMREMFISAEHFNQDISSWNVSSVTDMYAMFDSATDFNNGGKPLTWGEKTAQVRSMQDMFRRAGQFNQDVSGWNISSVTDIRAMFYYASSFTNGGVSLNVDTNAAGGNVHPSWDFTSRDVPAMTNIFENSSLLDSHKPKL